MSNPARNKRKGADWEIDLMNGLREVGEDAERLRLSGKDDEGDLVVRSAEALNVPYLVIEAKNAKFEPGVFVGEMETEVANFAKHRGLSADDVDGIVIVKRRGKNWRKAFVLTTVERYFDLPDAE
ncbi:holliday junction resolvase [Streptomyces phage Celia]|uniref:Holliday junction resolvase n=1 Tax=Streptomyces phage Celia TaxID=2590946 RepID=A0A516KRC1_9CAUD|nr:holliday junction resolvase [Streptomyces phage Celia]QDP44241.1 holliday junction resolvase [Streptomyces phage Celia]QFG10501.1 holliday junction resolvase [Streptomyces phage Urza]QJD50603.1 holliday junction resolvase [Streptomyces phage Itza]